MINLIDRDRLSPRISLDDISDYDSMGYDAAPRQEHSYLMTERPFSIGTQPKDGFVRYEEGDRPKAESGYYGILYYNRPLTDDEQRRYELVRVVDLWEVM